MTTTDPRTGHSGCDAHASGAGAGPDLPDDRSRSDAQSAAVIGDPNPLTGQWLTDTQASGAGEGTYSRNSHGVPDVQAASAVAGPAPEPTIVAATPNRSSSARDSAGGYQIPLDTQARRVAALGPPEQATAIPMPVTGTPALADPLLALNADILDDLERVRIANQNRLRQLTRDEPDADGEERGFGLSLDHPAVAAVAALVDGLVYAEHTAELNLRRQLRKHLLGPWVRAQRGVGEKQAARLLASIGDPYIRPEIVREDGTVEPSRPRTVSELWAYAGYHVLPAGHGPGEAHPSPASGDLTGSDPDQRCADNHGGPVGVAACRSRGQRANWSPAAKSRTHLVAKSCMKQLRKPCAVDDDLGYAVHVDGCTCSPYRVLYDQGRAKYAHSVHPAECKRCAPSGSPAPAGSPLGDAHKLARALRLVSKAVLRDLWREARRLHTGETT